MKYVKMLFPAFQIFLIAVLGCTKMDHTYKPFLEGGMKTYVGKPTSVQALPGRYRIKLAWPAPSDPSVVKAKIYWDNFSDSVEVAATGADTMSVLLNNMPEGTHNFTMRTFDDKGNQSLPMEFRGMVFGTIYESLILGRPIVRTTYEGAQLKIEWGGLSDTAIIGTHLIYTDANNMERNLYIPKTDTVTYLTPFQKGNLRMKTAYMPVRGGIDTLYTKTIDEYIKSLPIELSKTGWTATASSQDDRPGSVRTAANLLDNNVNTIWVNRLVAPLPTYPHWALIDMKSVQNNIEGFTVVQRTPLNGALKDIRLEGSIDGVSFVNYGQFTLANLAGTLFVNLPNPVNIRYFRLTGLNDYSSSNNISLAEVGAFTRN